jgi:methyl-accepting chemotaxis protein
MNELSKLRIRGVLMLTSLGWASTAALLLLTLLFDYPHEGLPVIVSIAMNLVPTYYADRERYDAGAGIALGLMAAIQPATLIFMLNGHPWQMEGHMFFFVGLAALTLVCDWRPIAAAAGLTIGHNLLLGYFVPEWVFIGSGDFLRIMVHVIAVSMVLGVLGPMMVHMGKLFVEQAEARESSDKSASSAREALETARLALEQVETEREKRLEIERREWPMPAATSLWPWRPRSKARSPRSSSRSAQRRSSWRMRLAACIASRTLPANSRPARRERQTMRRKARCACRPASATCRNPS